MSQKEVLQRFCRLASDVGDHIGNHHAHDCFCGENPLSRERNFQFSEIVMRFIENAVEVACATSHPTQVSS